MRSIGREFDSSYSCVMADKNHKGSAQKFGGQWTIMKVETVADYLKGYCSTSHHPLVLSNVSISTALPAVAASSSAQSPLDSSRATPQK
jgi:hypothetical protein